MIKQSPLFSTHFDEKGKSKDLLYMDSFPHLLLSSSPYPKIGSDSQKIGNWTSEPPIPRSSFEDFVTTIPSGKEDDMFLRFVRKILTWDPEVRATTSEIAEDEWLMRPTESMI